jgi:hypothetical protein
VFQKVIRSGCILFRLYKGQALGGLALRSGSDVILANVVEKLSHAFVTFPVVLTCLSPKR